MSERSLAEQFREAVEFETDIYPKHGCDLSQGRLIGAQDEHARLKPYLELAARAIEALDHIKSKRGARCLVEGCTCLHDRAHLLLEDLERLLEKQEGDDEC